MTLTFALQLTYSLLSLTMAMQGLEMFFISRKSEFIGVWKFDQTFLNLKVISFSQVIIASICLIYPNPYLFLLLFLSHLLVCIRFRGTFNGGSDMMIFVLLTGVLICSFAATEKVKSLGLIYISIHALYSYFKAGLVKFLEADWRNGLALPIFLSRSLYSNTRAVGRWLSAKPGLGLVLCWITILFELSAAILWFEPRFTVLYCVIAGLFHFFIFLSFGLNRFFWAWMTAWPAVVYTLTSR